MTMKTQKGAQKILQKERRQEKIINEIMQFDDGPASGDDSSLAAKLDMFSSLRVQEAKVDGVLFVIVVVVVTVVAVRDRKHDVTLCFFYFEE